MWILISHTVLVIEIACTIFIIAISRHVCGDIKGDSCMSHITVLYIIKYNNQRIPYIYKKIISNQACNTTGCNFSIKIARFSLLYMTNSKKCQKIPQADLLRHVCVHMLAIKSSKMIVIRFKQTVDTPPRFKLDDLLIYHYYSYNNFRIPIQKCPRIKFHIFIQLMLFSNVSV